MVGKKIKDDYKEAFYEVDKIIEIMPDELKAKIPENFKKFICENKRTNYNFSIDSKTSLLHQNLKQETKIILSLIYTSYICSAEEKKDIYQNDRIKIENKKKELNERYDVNKLFLKEKNLDVSEKNLETIKKENNIIKFIKDILKKLKRK